MSIPETEGRYALESEWISDSQRTAALSDASRKQLATEIATKVLKVSSDPYKVLRAYEPAAPLQTSADIAKAHRPLVANLHTDIIARLGLPTHKDSPYVVALKVVNNAKAELENALKKNKTSSGAQQSSAASQSKPERPQYRPPPRPSPPPRPPPGPKPFTYVRKEIVIPQERDQNKVDGALKTLRANAKAVKLQVHQLVENVSNGYFKQTRDQARQLDKELSELEQIFDVLKSKRTVVRNVREWFGARTLGRALAEDFFVPAGTPCKMPGLSWKTLAARSTS